MLPNFQISFLLFTILAIPEERKSEKESKRDNEQMKPSKIESITHAETQTRRHTAAPAAVVIANKNHCEFSIRITTLEMEGDGGYGLREINTFDAHHSNINYRAEGNANIVLALPLRCQVLRLPKSKRLCIVLYVSICASHFICL